MRRRVARMRCQPYGPSTLPTRDCQTYMKHHSCCITPYSDWRLQMQHTLIKFTLKPLTGQAFDFRLILNMNGDLSFVFHRNPLTSLCCLVSGMQLHFGLCVHQAATLPCYTMLTEPRTVRKISSFSARSLEYIVWYRRSRQVWRAAFVLVKTLKRLASKTAA